MRKPFIVRESTEMEVAISHDRDEESLEAKTKWFQTLSMNERTNFLCQFTDMLLGVNPSVVEQKDAQPIEGRVLVVSKT
jgi:hypothetical protein